MQKKKKGFMCHYKFGSAHIGGTPYNILVENRLWSTSGFIGRHHQNLAGALVCKLKLLWVPVVGGHQHAILKIKGTYGAGEL